MANIKQKVIKMIQSLPEEVTLDDIMAALYFRLQVDAGLKELDEGKGIPHEEVERRIACHPERSEGPNREILR